MDQVNRPTLGQGVVGGLVAGVVYFVVAIGITIFLGGLEAVAMPLRQIAAVALGQQALEPTYDLTKVVVTANVVHFALSALYGVLYALIAQLFNVRSPLALIVGGAIYGLVLYAANVFVIFPAFFPWFLANDRVLQATLHALAFGAVNGAWLARR